MNGFHLTRVLGWMMGAMISFSATAIAVRSFAGQLSVFEILSIRAGIGLIFMIVLGAITGELASALVPRRFRLHVVRNGLHFCAQSLWAWSIMLLPLATVFALEFTAPAWTMLLAIFFLGERLTVPIALGTLAVIAGAVVGAWSPQGVKRSWPLWAITLPLGASLIRAVGHAVTKIGLIELPSASFAVMIADGPGFGRID